MPKVIIVDDDISELEKTSALVRDYFYSEKDIRCSIEIFSSPKEFMDHISLGCRADIYILDIVMPNINGIDLGKYVKQVHKDAKIIYLTTSLEYGVESYDVQAVDYLVKPCSAVRLKQALDRVVAKYKEMLPRFFVKVPDGIYALVQRDILYVEYYDHRLIVHTVNGKRIESITHRESLASLADPLLKQKNFLRISASFIVNMDHIVKLTRTEFEIAGGRKLPISRTYNNSRSAYLDYILNIK